MNNDLMLLFYKGAKSVKDYYRKLVRITKTQKYVGSANEWILDNYYMINEQEKSIPLELIHNKINNKRKNQLYNLISEYLFENDYQINTEKLFSYLNDYQTKTKNYFSYMDVNFIPTAIKISLITKIAEMSGNLELYLDEKIEVDNYFEGIKSGYDVDIEKLLKKFEDKEISDYAYYLEQINYRLKVFGKSAEVPLMKLNELLKQNNFTIKELITLSHDISSTSNVLMGNLFNSFRMIINYEIESFYKNISLVEKILMNESVDVFNNLDDGAKHDYRGKIIKNARKKCISEYEYVKSLVAVADKNKIHVGEVLFKDGNYDFRIKLYIILVGLTTLVLTYFVSTYISAILFIFLLIPISNVVIEIYNYILTRFFKPKTIFKLKFKDGIPKNYATMVVIPTILSDKDKVLKMFERLEVYYISNKSDNLYFTLLGDAKGEKKSTVSYDKTIVELGLKKVEELNKKYGKNVFNFVYRNRFYNDSEEEYLGYERKRGALEHFNKLLLNKLTEEQKKKYFRVHTFDNFKTKIKYVITLDTDTQLVLNTAHLLVGAMAHPMNTPVLSENKDKVIKGYGIMQPRIGVDVKVTNKSLYSQLFGGLGGLDVYIRKSSDVYQDVFGEGSFVGKGIYDLEVFDTVLSNRFPDNLILSHDLLEGNYLRCGFINDIELFDDFPFSYLNDSSRHHRWNRGDWQIINWLKNKVKDKSGNKVKNPISTLGKWKIFDNLRRSLISFCLLFILIFGLIFDSSNSYRYLLIVSMLVGIPIIFYLFSNIISKTKYDIWIKYYMNLIFGFLATVNRSYIKFAILPYEAYLYFDSKVRALYRMFISKKKLLNWVTAEDVEKSTNNDPASYIREFVPNYIAAILIVFSSIYFDLHSGIIFVISFIWVTAPILMYCLSREIKNEVYELNEYQKKQIKELGVKTWGYFEDYLTEETNYLIPDNYQENRDDVIDYRTSSTNIGFSLVSVISAHALKVINTKKALDYIEKIITSVEKLEKWHGHLYNWYNIYTMKVIPPYFISTVDSGNFVASLYTVKGFLTEIGEMGLVKRIDKLIDDTDFTKLYNYDLEIFSIGYNVSDDELLSYNYNNFSSEARLTSYVAIAKGDIPYSHWFRLDKSMTKYKSYKGVASWSGSAFEYFMPLIFMKTYPHTLLDESYYLAYFAHKNFIKEIDNDLPWGISESAYSELDNSDNYKYQSFGIPYLKLQEIKKVPIVISPYSSIMALNISPYSVYENIEKFKSLDMYSKYGLYESYDNEAGVVVRNYYAHHQGMILSSIANYLSRNVIQKYFHSNQNVKSFEMLLKEKVQLRSYIDLKISKYKKYDYQKESFENDVREYEELKELPELGVLSNGYYTVLLNDRGGGFSKYNELQINRYRRMPQESYGMFVYIKDPKTNKIWSNTYYPLKIMPDKYKVVFATDRIKYTREDEGIVTNTEITVTKDHNAELRRLTLKNNNDYDVELELTSYSEVVLSKNAEDVAHRSFGGLMVNSEYLEDINALLFTRKSRSGSTYYVIHRLIVGGDSKIDDFETSRASFIGRNNSVYNPDAIYKKEKLDRKLGSVIDPVMSIRKKIVIPAHEEVSVNYLIGFGKSRSQVRDIAASYSDDSLIKRGFDLSTVFNNMRTSYYNLDVRKMRLFNRMLKYIYQSYPLNQDREKYLTYNTLSQSRLWKFGISGDLPIILVEIHEIKTIGFIRELLESFDYYKSRGLYIDIVIINFGDQGNYKYIEDYIYGLIQQINVTNNYLSSPGAIYQVDAKEFKENEYNLFRMVASVYLNAQIEKSLEEQIQDLDDTNENNRHTPYEYTDTLEVEVPKNIAFYNGYGGFIDDGKEYLITDVNTPMPWVNIMSNGRFGTVITNDLGGFTYTVNSREFKLTRWSNDAVGDPSSEIFIINNRRFKPSTVVHGFGYSIFTLNTKEYDIVMKVFVGVDADIKFYDLKVINKLKKSQEIKIDFVLKMVLGTSEEITHRYLSSKFDDKLNALLVHNSYNDYFKDKNVFITSTEKISEYQIFDAITKSISSTINLKANDEYNLSFMIGEDDLDKVLEYQEYYNVLKEYEKSVNYWKQKLNVVQVKTPDSSFDYMINGWYHYQTLASRLYARTGFYQVGGAYGYRDQLQDVMSILYSDPGFARNQILKHANHQFKEGDVLHWWHEELKFGSRTKFTDDYLWLVYVSYQYIKVTGDYSILEEQVGFVKGEQLKEHEHEKGINYEYTSDTASLYEHLKLCFKKALNQFGRHNLPLMGSGDWNDGMNMVGAGGQGESIFVGFFLYDLLGKMVEISEKYSDKALIERYLEEREKLKEALYEHAWDGEWYLRAYFDDGTPLGSHKNKEAQIDVVAQSWSILTGVASKEQKESIFREVENRLIDRDNKLIKLLTPGFKNSKPNPGYIMDYTVGVRENGAQYTHGALWYVMALLKEGKVDLGNKYFKMINPVNRTLTKDGVLRYQVEPYVIVADIYSNKENGGRGGWSWYTGSAGWAYKIGLEEILGFKKTADILRIEPKINPSWNKYTITYRYISSVYEIEVLNPDSLSQYKTIVKVDGKEIDNGLIKLVDDGKSHKVEVILVGDV